MPTPHVPHDDDLSSHVPPVAQTLLRLAQADRRAAAEFLAASYRDELTGTLQRRPGRERLAKAVARAQRLGSELFVVFLDVDGLKAVNDRAGHEAGDRLLAAAGRALCTSLRDDDVVVRYGGDEFVCALAALTAADVHATLDRVHSSMSSLEPGGQLSAGWTRVTANDDLDTAIARADTHLYRRRLRRRGDDDSAGPARARTSVACGDCGDRIELEDFVLVSHERMTRIADCPGCGEATIILLARGGLDVG